MAMKYSSDIFLTWFNMIYALEDKYLHQQLFDNYLQRK